jgi:hypothetical protein
MTTVETSPAIRRGDVGPMKRPDRWQAGSLPNRGPGRIGRPE